VKIPKKVRIGNHYYNIKKVRVVDWKNKDVAGDINYGIKRVRLKKFKDERMNQEIFFHEVAHGILKELEFNYPQIIKFRNDEIFVQELGLTLRKTVIDLLNNQRS